MKDRVLIIFEETPGVASKEDIFASEGLKSPYADMILIGELRENKGLFDEYKGFLDCTAGNKILNALHQAGQIREMKDNLGEFYMSPRGYYIRRGPSANKLFAINSYADQEMNEYSKIQIKEFKEALNTLLMKCPSIANKIKFSEGLKEGIDIGGFLPGKTNEAKRTLLVSKIPARKDSNTEYVTPIGIDIAERLLKIKKEAE